MPAYTRLRPVELEVIVRGLGAGLSGAEIGRMLGRPAKTINEEIRRGGGRDAYQALGRVPVASPRKGTNKIADHAPLREEVCKLIVQMHASPRQAALALHKAHPGDPSMTASHETIYDFIYVHSRGALRKELLAALRRGKQARTPRSRQEKAVRQTRFEGGIPIAERPADVEGRAIPGHWEADLLMGKGNKTAILVLVERHSRFTLLELVREKKDARSIANAIHRLLRHLPEHLRRSLTVDNGSEMADHLRLSARTKMPVYFCNPHSPWQKGSVENTNGLLRQYFPKGMDFHELMPSAVSKAQQRLNMRPRICFNGDTPANVFLLSNPPGTLAA
jgi:IS30 family transposase